ncbi:N-acetyllactosaminide 3-alpha-galactosyltransferase [Fasciola gigantica]|uniref:N-acetyllactosaminide 3-alpha-galactosyltransferase n=1 Tax=Fasciola gigantica TaxID=46835 RepID=A0A504Y7A9_FASGI|nr:N-acetyllactosaminide 3-alpha-galactosyltransferase [Fasciola gigantica]
MNIMTPMTNLDRRVNITNLLGGSTPIGVWSPIECKPKERLALILPYRDRDEHLRVFLNHMHPFLRHQQLMYTIIVVEQLGSSRFNRASLFNVGFRESSRIAEFDCFIFHDVDLLPEDDRLPYRCGKEPIHLSVSVDALNYKLMYPELFGGAVALSRDHFEKIRGFSNVFFGWGGEDDDLYYRVKHHHYRIFRHPSHIARYTMIKHKRDKSNPANPERHRLLKSSSRSSIPRWLPGVKVHGEICRTKVTTFSLFGFVRFG